MLNLIGPSSPVDPGMCLAGRARLEEGQRKVCAKGEMAAAPREERRSGSAGTPGASPRGDAGRPADVEAATVERTKLQTWSSLAADRSPAAWQPMTRGVEQLAAGTSQVEAKSAP